MKRYVKFLHFGIFAFGLAILISTFGNGCGIPKSTDPVSQTGGTPVAATRNFLMGFSPWPWDATQAAVDWTFEKINEHGDIISQHLEEGVPWPEALSGASFSTNFQNLLQDRKNRAVSGKKVLLQLNPMDINRSALAPFRGNNPNEPLTAPWSTYSFDSAQVKTAYLNYVNRVADILKPDFIQIGIEVNLLIRNAPSKWASYVNLQCYVYQQLKISRPSTPVFVSVFSVPYFPEWSNDDVGDPQLQGLADVSSCSDMIAFSVHPFMSALLAESFPENYFDRLFALTNKPIGISESSYSAQVWSLNGLTWNGTPQKQKEFVRLMFSAAEKRNAKFVIWYTVRDYDQLWKNALGQSDATLVWRDTGLYDENGLPREALSLWIETFKKQLKP